MSYGTCEENLNIRNTIILKMGIALQEEHKFEFEEPGLESQLCHLLAECMWTGSLNFLEFYFFN